MELARVLAAPFAGRILAEMGADVIKVEYGQGDPAREIGPHLEGRSLYFAAFNSGKRGVWLDLRSEEGRAHLDALIDSADIILENFRRSTAEALDLTPERLLERHPQLVVLTVSSYARSGERADEGAFDLTIQAESGVMSVTGEPGRPPVRAGVPISDLAAGMWAVSGALGALFARERQGRGRHVEVPMLDATLPLLSYMATAALATGHEPEAVGSGHHSVSPYGAFATSDGWIVIAALSDKFWLPLCEALGLTELVARPELRTTSGRLAARDEVDAAVARATSAFSSEIALNRLAAAGVPHAPVNSVIEALTSSYVGSRGLVTIFEADEGKYGVVMSPLGRGGALRPAPALGEHTGEVLGELGD